ncbi:phage major capsid protein [Streptomyces sp. NBC_00996]|uniref:phage major capsid protein n=1 Tax=Streptomyces sp. NBC_00996 TaxID=2903710 RepID=UPI003867C25E|nr:phage major capsid protein [Streptomyces sp. NBC_00996]
MSDDKRRVRSILDGIVEGEDGIRRYTETDGLYSRVVPLDNIEIVSRAKGGDGRTVRAYAAVFDSPAEIRDQDGHYQEQISRTAFEQSLAMRSRAVGVFYNHGRTLHGTPSERASVPLGRPVMIKADGRGLLTESQYNRTQLADDILESIRNGDITGQSFTGIFLRSDPKGPYLPSRSGDLSLVTRQEIALIEYGPTPIPAYQDAEILGVRAASTVDQGNIDTANAADLDTAARQHAASQGWAMEDGSYPIRPLDSHGRTDLEAAVRAVGRGSGSHDAIRAHIVKRAKALGLAEMIPASWPAAPTTPSGGSNAAAGSTSSTSGRDDASATGTPAATSTGAATRQDAPAGAAPEPQTTHSATTRTTSQEGTAMDDRMTVEERASRQSEIRARLAEIDNEFSGAVLPEETQTEWDGLQTEYAEHDRAIEAASARAEQLAALAGTEGATERVDNTRAGFGGGRQAPNQIRRPENIYDLAEVRRHARSIEELPTLYRDRAMRAIEQAAFPGVANREAAQERAAYLVDTIDDEDGTLARRMLQTGSPLYNRAFGKMMTRLSVNGLTAEESRALSLGVDASGGFAVPFQLDPTVILTSDGTINPLREVARVEQIVGKTWQGVTAAGVTVTRGAETDEAPDSSPTLGQPEVDTNPVQGFVPFTTDVERSWNAMRSEITMLLQDAKDTEEATSFTLGDGTGTNAGGIVTTLPAGSKVGQTGAAGALTVPDDIFAIEEALPPRFRARGSWLGNKSIYNKIRGAASGKSGYAGDLWARLANGQPPELIGYAARELSSMDGTIEASGSGANLILLFGDYRRGFIIVDRIGMAVELVPHLFGANGRPKNQRGIWAHWSNNSKVLVPEAIRVLNVVSPV